LPKTDRPTNPRDTAFTVQPQYIALRTTELSLSVRIRDGHTTVIFTTGTLQYSAVIDHITLQIVQHYETFNDSTNSSPSTGPPRPLPATPLPEELPLHVRFANALPESPSPPPLVNGAFDSRSSPSEELHTPPEEFPLQIQLVEDDLDSLNPANNQ
jgi:hypothetical protein